jgi:hypothetical protein
VTDIFFSYKSDDRERVRPVRDAFAAQGFDVFWDQQVPAGVDWDSWIRQHLTQSKCAVVFWSAASVASDNVRHEATVAKQQRKLIPVLLEPLTPEQFPMGFYMQQCASLTNWRGDFGDPEWAKLRREVEAKLTPLWVHDAIQKMEAELAAERARREAAEARSKDLQGQTPKEVLAQLAQQVAVLRRERGGGLKTDTTGNLNTLYCNFCGKSQYEVLKLIAGPTVFICDECAVLCVEIVLSD